MRRARSSASAGTGVILGLLIAAGVGVRAAAHHFSRDYGLPVDHVTFMAWSDYAYKNGVTRIYDLEAGEVYNVRPQPRENAPSPVMLNELTDACNYPPLACCIFWFQGWLWHGLDSQIIRNHIPPDYARQTGFRAGPVHTRLIGTRASRFAHGLPNMAADFLLAWGVWSLVRRIGGEPGRARRALIAFGAALLAPPVFLDSAYWNQNDAWIASCFVWCLSFLTVSRFLAAGVVMGLGLMLKAQAILFAPTLAFVFVALVLREGGGVGYALRAAGKLVGAAALTTVLIAAPFSIASVGHAEKGAARWFYRSYQQPILEQYPKTTVQAYNVWWLEYLRDRDNPHAQRSDVKLAGLTKDAIGKLLLAGGVLAAAGICIRRWGWRAEGWLVFTALTLLSAFLLPTRVHERYIYYCLPLFMAACAVSRAFLWPLIGLLIVATAEVTWPIWFDTANTPDWVWKLTGALAALALLSYLYALLMPLLSGRIFDSSANA